MCIKCGCVLRPKQRRKLTQPSQHPGRRAYTIIPRGGLALYGRSAPHGDCEPVAQISSNSNCAAAGKLFLTKMSRPTLPAAQFPAMLQFCVRQCGWTRSLYSYFEASRERHHGQQGMQLQASARSNTEKDSARLQWQVLSNAELQICIQFFDFCMEHMLSTNPLVNNPPLGDD